MDTRKGGGERQENLWPLPVIAEEISIQIVATTLGKFCFCFPIGLGILLNK